jgi:Ca-activated chloride channel family protein
MIFFSSISNCWFDSPMKRVLAVSIFFFLAALSRSQDIRETVKVDLVNVYLSATDSKGHFITDLKREELILKENGTAQSITHFSNFANDQSDKLGEKDVPLTLALVIDKSESMSTEIQGTNKLDIVKNAAFRLLDELKTNDRMTLISFNDMPTEETPLISDKKRISTAILFQGVEGGYTSLLDSVYFAMDKLKGQQGRKIIVVFSDGEDTASHLKLDEVISNLVASDVTVLAFGTMALGSNSLRGRYVLEKLAEASGGYAFFPTSLRALNDVMEKLRAGMRSQYSLGYKPMSEKNSAAWRVIDITCKRPGVKLRYRKGYIAS